MAIERKRRISSLNVHWATQDIFDRNDVKLKSAGDIKTIEVRYAEVLEEDGVALKIPANIQSEVLADLSDPKLAPVLGKALADIRIELAAAKAEAAKLKQENEALKAAQNPASP